MWTTEEKKKNHTPLKVGRWTDDVLAWETPEVGASELRDLSLINERILPTSWSLKFRTHCDRR